MKTLEQKAREYISKQCGLTPKDNYYNNIQNAYIAGYTEALRWRDVNVELPEMGVDIFVKCEDRVTSRPIYWVSWLDRKGHFCGLKTMGNDYTNEPTHWRPIETI